MIRTATIVGKSGVCFEGRLIREKLERIEQKMLEQSRQWMRARLAGMPAIWGKQIAAEHGRRGGLECSAANAWLIDVTKAAGGRLPLAATDLDIREAAEEAERVAILFAKEDIRNGAGNAAVRMMLDDHCRSWGIEPAQQEGIPGMLRMLDKRWYLRRLRRAHGRRAEGAAIAGGVVRRGLWPYASQDAVQRRQDQRARNRAAMDRAEAVAADGERVAMADVVAGSLANPENKKAELMVRIRGCDGYAALQGWACEFWTLTTPSRFHAQRITGACAEANPNYQGATPREAQQWLCRMWARARAAWKRRGLAVAGLRTAEPHHDGCPHWHLIVYGPAEDVRLARQLLRVYAMRDSGGEPGAWEHRFNFKHAESGTGAAAYAAAYVSKNIDGSGMDGERDTETGRKISDAVKRVDAWAAHWGIRQFQFFGMPAVGIWRCLRRVETNTMPPGSDIYQAWMAADDSDWCSFWIHAVRGGLALIKQGIGRLTEYGDEAAETIAGVAEGARRLLLKARDWVIHWGGIGKKSGGVAFDLPRSCVSNCTRGDLEKRAEEDQEEKRRRGFALVEREFAGMAAAIFEDARAVA